MGAYNSFLAYGKKTNNYNLSFAHLLNDKKELEKELLKVKLPVDFKILLTGGGRVSSGVVEILKILNIQAISKEDFFKKKLDYPTYLQLMPSDYNEKKDGSLGSKKEFYNYPDKYKSCLLKFCCQADMLITGHYYAPNSPVLLTKEDLKSQLFKTKVIGDISCDINGPIASTIRPSTIEDPIYGYNSLSGLEDDYMKNNVLVVMAVDNLPCSLPKDASIDFGQVFINQVLPDLLQKGVVTTGASITLNGSLTDGFKYLSDYIS